MITTRKLYELFEFKWFMQRQNPGGTSPHIQGYLLGFAGIIDITKVLDSVNKTGTIKLKIGNGEVQTKVVDFSDADPDELIPVHAAGALNDANFVGCSFDVDEETGRLKLTPTDSAVKWIQIYGDLAAALHFGNCRLNEGKGCFIWASFDGDLKNAAETEQWTENKEIVNDSPRGAPVKFTSPGKRTGTQIVLTDRLSSRMAKQMINGGRWIDGTVDTPEIYEPPVSGSNSETGRIDVFTYSEIFDKNNSTEGSEAFIRERMYIGCVGNQKRTGGGGSHSDSEYTLTAADYTGEDGEQHASPRESDYTQAQWDALQMSGVFVNDWETA